MNCKADNKCGLSLAVSYLLFKEMVLLRKVPVIKTKSFLFFFLSCGDLSSNHLFVDQEEIRPENRELV
jgi:hypothetical protein